MTDEAARRAALDPTQSFIVQAPAGSGKTELLIQRYLVLLATVEEPEQIVAITFTRKAAAEMRNRVAAALQDAAGGATSAEPHRATTLELARAVLQRGERLGWALTSFPGRLGIETLDALNARLARQLPALSGGAGHADIVDDASAFYSIAARRTVGGLSGGDALAETLAQLLRRLDNSVPRLEALLAELLPKREQWLRHLVLADETALRAELERALERCVEDELQRAADAMPAGAPDRLAPLLAHAAQHATGAAADVLGKWSRPDAACGPPATLDEWRAVASLLLTKQGEWRRKVDRSIGFGPAHREQRAALRDLLDELAGNGELKEALQAVTALPEPRYSDDEWDALAALRVVLLHLAAELRVLFAERQTVDFVELALAAQQALGRTDAPSELLLALDRRIQHILVDEFQDTSHSQFRLLELLTSGWEAGDGRSLFLVGDPMQSIYRFRDADMSLFLRVRNHGIGSVTCRPLTLQSNFRSAPAIVAWVNETFQRVFPAGDDVAAGAARFSASVARRNGDPHAGVEVHAMCSSDADDELSRTVELVRGEHHREPHQSIAVLVQSRSHLTGLQERLQAAGLRVHAVEIDPLNERQVVQDLIGLTRALLHPADRIAWLAVLRAPWCGLGWEDLEALCGAVPSRHVSELLWDEEALGRVGDAARSRLRRLKYTLADALERRGELPFVEWIERTWLGLDGPSCLESPDEARAAEQFFALLESAVWRGDVEDPATLESVFCRPETNVAPGGEGAVEIMTIHKAKGLEFDTVILPGLGREPRREDARALYWMERTAGDGSFDLLMAPLSPPNGDDRLTRFIRRADDARERAERARLLYVAATRARRRLHLVCRLDPDADTPGSRTLLAPLWPGIETAFAAVIKPQAAVTEAELPEAVTPVLRRLVRPSDGGVRADPAAVPRRTSTEARPEFEWASRPAVHVGTLVHRYLQRMAGRGLAGWNVQRVRELVPTFERELALLGLDRGDVREAAERVARALSGVLEDPDGRWVLGERLEAKSELRLTLRAPSGFEQIRLDRTFVDEQGTRWIVDYKTGTHEGGDLEAFVDSEVERYRPQLQRYAAALASIDPRPIRVGLYFPLLGLLRSWTAGGAS